MRINSTQAIGPLLRSIMGPLSLLLISMLLLPQSCKKPDDFHPKGVELKLIADGLVSPLGVVEAPDNSGRLFIIDQVGKIWIVDKDGNKKTTPFLDLTHKLVPLDPNFDERGLLGFAFHPDYQNNGRVFVYFNLRPRPGGPEGGGSWDNLARIAEFRVSATNPDIVSLGSEKIILQLDDPQSNHNGGTIAFGKDGYLYIAIGDGGAADDVAPGHVDDWYDVNEGGNGQDIERNLFGNILRIDVNGAKPYAIPADNPFVNKPGLDEIWAYGFRNPYRISFDMGGANWLYAGDAGQVLYEEVDIVTKGGNYGWNVKEGTHCFNAANNDQVLPSCPTEDVYGNELIDPVIEVNNAANPQGGKFTTVIGGNVYRGKSIHGWQGKYLFGSFSQNFDGPNAELFIATPGGSGLWDYEEVNPKGHPNDLGYFLKGFGQDNDGEIYITVSTIMGPSGTTGKVYKLVPQKKKWDKDHDDDDDHWNGGKY
jgi:glucose/arabinose dehydrogenase